MAHWDEVKRLLREFEIETNPLHGDTCVRATTTLWFIFHEIPEGMGCWAGFKCDSIYRTQTAGKVCVRLLMREWVSDSVSAT